MSFDTGFMTEQLYETLKTAFEDISTPDFLFTVGYAEDEQNRLNISVKHADEGTLYFYTLKVSQV